MAKTITIIDTLGRSRAVTYRYPYATLPVGKFFFVKNPDQFGSIRATLSKYQRKHGKYFFTRKTQRGLKVVRWY